MVKGLFITFEGIEGCGKSTQAKLLKEYLEKKGLKTILSMEPGGTEIGQKIRNILVDPKYKGILHPVTEALLYQADRNQHLKEKIIPHLNNGYVVICDRYQHSSLAYQCYGRELDIEKIEWVFRNIVEGIEPDIVFLIDIDEETSLKRVNKRAQVENIELSRFEIEHKNFHKRVRQGFLALAKENNNFVVIDGKKSIEDIHKEIVSIVEKRLKNV
ncbi:dTMP kinase [Thermotomaculum hydrothermale]|uniref:Thymidylate kinase n=1 Tax=Thermotomaculum hydrothermale TaxID=981385 RepID=A0A7R6SZP1_9BACT|nr:dTMP kinase [Thermotomaculum hydrothermale]BBB33015.1 dTMP kinase [Thermotomaculum hydrothermale]